MLEQCPIQFNSINVYALPSTCQGASLHPLVECGSQTSNQMTITYILCVTLFEGSIQRVASSWGNGNKGGFAEKEILELSLKE